MFAIQKYLENLQGQTVSVIGMGVSNTPLIRMLLRSDVSVVVRDKSPRERVLDQVEELESLGATMILGEDYLENLTESIIFRTPGMHPNTPELKSAREQGSQVTSEMELFFQTCPCPIIGVTGSDGKTTTTTIIAEFLITAGYNVFIGGNIGKPLLPDVADMEPTDYAVVELSSFQLMTMEQSPEIAVFTNLSPNHLDYHQAMGEYSAAKENIFIHQSEDDKVIFNNDNQLTLDLSLSGEGKVTLFSRQNRLEDGVYLRDGAIWLTNKQGSREVLPLRDIRLPGVHNIENYMAAIAAVDGIVPDKYVREVATEFNGVEHRIQLIRELNGVKYYNDSIGTSPTRTVACLKSFEEKVILIAGGYDKAIPFDILGMEIAERVKTLVLTGATAKAIRESVEQCDTYIADELNIIEVDDFTEAVTLAHTMAKDGDRVILSPACAAFDKFKNFMERGNRFAEIVNSFEK